MDVDTTQQLADELTTEQLADELFWRLDQVSIEERERNAEGVAAAIFTLLCPHCAKRRKAKALAMRRWRAKRQAAPGG